MKSLSRPLYVITLPLLIIFAAITVSYMLKALKYNDAMTNEMDLDDPALHLVFISQERDNPYSRLIEHGARVAAERNGATLEYMGPVQGNMAEQLRMIEMAAASKIDGIITQGLNDSQFTPVINKAMEIGIPVITVDSDAPSSKRIAYVGTDNYGAGLMAGKALIAATKGQANVGIITGAFNASHQKERVLGILEAVKHEDGIRIVDMKESKFDRIGAAAAAHGLVTEYPELNTFIGTSAQDGLGISQMLNDYRSGLHVETAQNKEFAIIAFDNLPETVDLIEKGDIDATMVQQPYQMGVASVELMLEYLNGQKIITMYNTDVSIVDKSNLTRDDKGGTSP